MACFICLDGPAGPSGPTGPSAWPSGPTGPTGPTGPSGLTFLAPLGLMRLGCACRSDNGLAHVECMARLARANGRGEWRTCRTCMTPLSGPMLHLLNGRAAGSCDSIESVCGIHEIARELAVASATLNGRTCFRVPMPPSSAYRALSVAARTDEAGLYYETVLIDERDGVVHSSSTRFGAAEAPLLIRHVRSLSESEPR
jgi:hypothetical protein